VSPPPPADGGLTIVRDERGRLLVRMDIADSEDGRDHTTWLTARQANTLGGWRLLTGRCWRGCSEDSAAAD
jgi:hypothetical protein